MQLFPASTFVLAPYLGLILPIAVIQGNPQLPFILSLLGLALVGCLSAEGLLLPLRAPRAAAGLAPGPSDAALRKITLGVFVVSCVSRVVFILAGGGSLIAQLGGDQGSPITSIASLFSSWSLFALGLIFACYRRGACTRTTLWLGIGVLAVIETWAVLQTTVTAPLLQFATAIFLIALVLGMVRLRTLLVTLIIVLVAWPTLYTLRNSLRVEMGASVDRSVSAFDRLRFDEQLSSVAQFDVPVDAGQPDAVDILRYGLIPRVLDPNRPDLSSARLINRILGGSETSSFNFLSIGTLYFFYGPVGLVVYYFGAALLFRLVVSRSVRAGPIALCMATLAGSSLLGWASTFPDAVIGYLQALVAFIPVLVLLVAFRKRQKAESRSPD
jgi:hypothetical protein